MRRWIWILCLAACGGGSDDDESRDGGPARDVGDVAPTVEVGTGEQAFASVETGGRVLMQRGPQASGDARYNGYHLWLALRAQGIDPTDAMFTFTVRAGDTQLATGAYRQTLQAEGGDYVVYGQRLILSDCCLAEDAEIELSVQLTDGAGRTASDVRTVRGGECVRGLPNPTVDPCP